MLKFSECLKKISIKFILLINLLFTTFVLLFWIIDRKITPIGSSINELLKSKIYEKPSKIYKIDSEIENKIKDFKSSLNINENELIDSKAIKDLFWANEIKKGGYILNKKASDVKISDILIAVDERIKTIGCKKQSKQGCNGRSSKCITHDFWEELEDHINDFFTKKKLEDLINQTKFN